MYFLSLLLKYCLPLISRKCASFLLGCVTFHCIFSFEACIDACFEMCISGVCNREVSFVFCFAYFDLDSYSDWCILQFVCSEHCNMPIEKHPGSTSRLTADQSIRQQWSVIITCLCASLFHVESREREEEQKAHWWERQQSGMERRKRWITSAVAATGREVPRGSGIQSSDFKISLSWKELPPGPFS